MTPTDPLQSAARTWLQAYALYLQDTRTEPAERQAHREFSAARLAAGLAPVCSDGCDGVGCPCSDLHENFKLEVRDE